MRGKTEWEDRKVYGRCFGRSSVRLGRIYVRGKIENGKAVCEFGSGRKVFWENLG